MDCSVILEVEVVVVMPLLVLKSWRAAYSS